MFEQVKVLDDDNNLLIRHCKKPCHDCPYVASHPAYVDALKAMQNAEDLGNPQKVELCHFAASGAGRLMVNCTPPDNPRSGVVACAGSILAARVLQTPKAYDKNLDVRRGESDLFFISLLDFTEHIGRTSRERWLNWYSMQPKHRQKRIRDAGGVHVN